MGHHLSMLAANGCDPLDQPTSRREVERHGMKGGAVDRPHWSPADMDLGRPSLARLYDYYLGGSHNFAVDRKFAHEVLKIRPKMGIFARTSRAFLRRSVRYLLDQGIRQFLDLGSGIPTAGHVHEIAHAVDPSARVIYVDNEAVAIAHSQAILAGHRSVAAILADLRRPDMVLESPEVHRLLDFRQPIGLLMVGVAHFLSDDDEPGNIIATYRDVMSSGSHLVISHANVEPPPATGDMLTLYATQVIPITIRSEADIAALFAGYELVPPGLVPVTLWRPESPHDPLAEEADVPLRVGVGRK